MSKLLNLAFIVVLLVIISTRAAFSRDWFEPHWYTLIKKARDACCVGDFAKTEDWLTKALSDARKSGHAQLHYHEFLDLDCYYPETFSNWLASIADIYEQWKSYDRAELLFKKAMAIEAKLEYKYRLAQLYKQQGRLSEAEQLCPDALYRSLDAQPHPYFFSPGDKVKISNFN